MRERKWLILSLIAVFILSLNVQATSGHVNLNIKNSGLKKVLREVVRHYQKKGDHSVYIIPKASIDGKIMKTEFETNPIIKALREQFLSFDLNKDLSFKVNWSEIKVEAVIDEDSLQIHSEGKDELVNVAIKTDFKKINISGDYIEICQFYDDEGKCNENNGLYGRFNNFSLSLESGIPLTTLLETSVRLSENWIVVNFKKMMTNIFSTSSKIDITQRNKYKISKKSPKFDLSFEKFIMPPPILIVNGRKFVINVDHIGQVMHDKKEFLSRELVSAAGKFIAKDMVRILNEKIFNHIGTISKHFKLIDYNKYESYKKHFLRLSEISPQKAVKYALQYDKEGRDESITKKIKSSFSKIIYNAENKLSLDAIKTEKRKDLHISLNNVLSLNKKEIKIQPKVWNGLKPFKPIDFSQHKSMIKEHEVAFSISEPMINSILNSGIKVGLLNNIFRKIVGKQGVSLSGFNLHFVNQEKSCSLSKIKAVAMLKIKLSNLKREKMSDHVMYGVGELLESEWEADGFPYIPLPVERELELPIELDLNFNIRNNNKKTILSFSVDPYLVENEFSNSFNYPEMKMSEMVRNSIHAQVLEGLSEIEGKIFDVNITEHIQKIPGFKLKLQDILIDDNGHVVFALNIDEVNLNQLKKVSRGE